MTQQNETLAQRIGRLRSISAIARHHRDDNRPLDEALALIDQLLAREKFLDKAVELLTEQNRQQQALLERAREHPVFAYLLGEGDLEGSGFGDDPPVDPIFRRRLPYWWRRHLREALAATDPNRVLEDL